MHFYLYSNLPQSEGKTPQSKIGDIIAFLSCCSFVCSPNKASHILHSLFDLQTSCHLFLLIYQRELDRVKNLSKIPLGEFLSLSLAENILDMNML